MIKPNRGRLWLDWQRRAFTLAKWAGLVAVLLLMASFLFGEMGLPRYMGIRQHAQQLERDIIELRRLNTELRADLERIQHDPVRLEELARERLGYVKNGETVYQLVPGHDNRQPPSMSRP